MSRKFAKVYPNVWKSKKLRDVSAKAKLLAKRVVAYVL